MPQLVVSLPYDDTADSVADEIIAMAEEVGGSVEVINIEPENTSEGRVPPEAPELAPPDAEVTPPGAAPEALAAFQAGGPQAVRPPLTPEGDVVPPGERGAPTGAAGPGARPRPSKKTPPAKKKPPAKPGR